MVHNPEKKKSSKPVMDEPKPDPNDVFVSGGLTEGTHQPFVSIAMGDRGVRLPLDDAMNMGSMVFQQAGIRWADSMLMRYAQVAMGMDMIQALQFLSNLHVFRSRQAEAEMNAHAQAQAEALLAMRDGEKPDVVQGKKVQ